MEIMLSKNLKGNLVSVKKTCDRVKNIKLSLEDKIIIVVSVYAPQAGCDEKK